MMIRPWGRGIRRPAASRVRDPYGDGLPRWEGLQGLRGYKRWRTDIEELFEEERFQPEGIRLAADGRWVVLGRLQIRVKESGDELDVPLAHVFEQRDQKVARFTASTRHRRGRSSRWGSRGEQGYEGPRGARSLWGMDMDVEGLRAPFVMDESGYAADPLDCVPDGRSGLVLALLRLRGTGRGPALEGADPGGPAFCRPRAASPCRPHRPSRASAGPRRSAASEARYSDRCGPEVRARRCPPCTSGSPPSSAGPQPRGSVP